ncbi:MAG: cytochrome D1 domain-containing protein [Paracoccus sp. (in: a-proteobacteria)]|uniref:cytochrome D1 domain-containing protein n=1 Tax=Paracoccus sp. TaxID=267 RepID=UPI0026DEF8EF|nr:cytochrome D1 domain-containing protein [Paracoccus sp. (in: a-proteobacteria)]MDO5630328.1 cytochrome D1 domain-containing protein [Paracoccus sp. (in: a-proteobacteria)]
MTLALRPLIAAATLLALPGLAHADTYTTGEMGVVIERATGSVLVVSQTKRNMLARIEGLGDLSHASVTFSPDQRFAYVFGRDGGLTKIDLTTRTIDKRIIQGGNAIGGAISDDGKLVAVSNYEPGGVKVFNADTLELVADIPMDSKTVGLADVPGSRFIVATWDSGQAWLLDHSADPANPEITVFQDVGANPYDALMTGDGRTYIVGLFGEKGLTAIDLWADDPQPVRFLPDYGKDQDDLPVYKMPHLQGWTLAGDSFALPAVGLHQLLWVDAASLSETGRTDLHGQPIFALARPDQREIWVNFAPPDNDTVQVIDTMTHQVIQTLTPGPGVLHMEFTPRGREVWLSVRDENRIEIRDTRSYEVIGEIPAQAPSGIFFTDRAYRLGL